MRSCELSLFCFISKLSVNKIFGNVFEQVIFNTNAENRNLLIFEFYALDFSIA